MQPAPLTVARVARAAGVGLSTVRFYERRGLIERPQKPARGYRVYSSDTIESLRFIQRAKTMGFSLEEIRELLGLRARRGASCDGVRERARAKLIDVERRIGELAEIRDALRELVKACRGPRTTDDCSILKTLFEGATNGKRRRR
jgi:MerR family transcriptional regulator, copper efflux regulator